MMFGRRLSSRENPEVGIESRRRVRRELRRKLMRKARRIMSRFMLFQESARWEVTDVVTVREKDGNRGACDSWFFILCHTDSILIFM